MKILDIPYFVEFFFILSTVVFVVALYAILPTLIYENKPFSTLSSIWQKGVKNFYENVEKLIGLSEKKSI